MNKSLLAVLTLVALVIAVSACSTDPNKQIELVIKNSTGSWLCVDDATLEGTDVFTMMGSPTALTQGMPLNPGYDTSQLGISIFIDPGQFVSHWRYNCSATDGTVDTETCKGTASLLTCGYPTAGGTLTSTDTLVQGRKWTINFVPYDTLGDGDDGDVDGVLITSE